MNSEVVSAGLRSYICQMYPKCHDLVTINIVSDTNLSISFELATIYIDSSEYVNRLDNNAYKRMLKKLWARLCNLDACVDVAVKNRRKGRNPHIDSNCGKYEFVLSCFDIVQDQSIWKFNLNGRNMFVISAYDNIIDKFNLLESILVKEWIEQFKVKINRHIANPN